MLWQFPISIRCYDSQTKAEYDKTFTKEELIEYIKNQFKTPGQYNLRNTKHWQGVGNKYAESQARTGRPNFEGGRYTEYPKDSFKEKQFFEQEKANVKNGRIVDGWYIPPFYHWYLNYCPIVDSVKVKKKFGDVWDGDYWFFQYIMLCMLLGKHACVVKARQRGYTLKIMALLYWCYSWFETSVNTIGAYKEDYVLKSWRFLEFYRKHINEYTRWQRGPVIPKSLAWEETTMTDEGKPYGLDSKLSGTTFKVSPENGVGGSQTIFFYEEAGIAPTLLKTVGYVRPSLEKGNKVTGLIICSGAVGELDDAQDLKEIFYNPDKHNFLHVTNIWDTDINEGKPCGLFVSEAYNLEGFMDEDGNSLVDKATAFVEAHNLEVTQKKKKELAQLDTSQKPLSPSAAFDERKSSEFPIQLMRNQQDRIRLKYEKNNWKFKPQTGHLEEDDNGVVKLRPTDAPEMTYPVNPDWDDKRGWVTIYEPPRPNSPFYTYFGGHDAVEADDAVGSESLVSLHIFQNVIEVEYTKDGKTKKRIEGDKIVATYYGRFSSVEKTNEQCWLLIKMYSAFVFAERSKPNFINYMLRYGRHQYLAKESDVPFFKDLNLESTATNSSKYGFVTTNQNEMWKHIKSYIKEYIRAEYGYDTITKANGDEEVVKIYRGMDRIDDYWLLEELIRFVEKKGNYDKMVSFGAVLMIAKTWQRNNIGIIRVSEVEKKKEKEQIIKKPVSLLGGGGVANYNMLTGRTNKKISLL